MAKIKVTVLEGTIDDGKKTYVRGDFLSLEAKEAAPLIESGVLVKGEAKVDGFVAAEASDEPKSLAAATFVSFIAAVEKLEKDEPNHWTGDDKPDLVALKEAGCNVTAAERDEGWALYNTED